MMINAAIALLAYLDDIRQLPGSINHHMDRLEVILRDGFRLPKIK